MINIKRWNRKSGTRFHRIIDECGKFVYSVAMDILKNADDAQDCSQMCFEKIMQNMDKIEELNSPQMRRYIYKTVKSAAIDIIRSKDRYILTEDEKLETLMDNSAVNDELSSAEWREDFKEIFNKLSEEERELLILKFYEDKTYKYIADKLGISEEACKKRGQRLKEKVAVMITEMRRKEEES
ncbi:MAG: sigma-70 family RNA polymerase sigma factor [Firmicutes bacterium]|nr:sigma-70 family RNA polymerase sigma factor [Bacillota bacterium]